MALAYNIVRRGSLGDMWVKLVDVTLDSAYAAGGYDLDERSVGLGTNGSIDFVLATPRGGFIPDWNPATGRLLIRDASGAANVATPEVGNNLGLLNGLVVRLLIIGRGSPG